MHQPLTAERLRDLLHYDPATGIFTWTDRHGRWVKAGDVAGTITARGYVSISISGKKHRAHRLAWLYMTGQWPEKLIDHKDTVPTHNWFDNLRDVSNTVNMQNQQRPYATKKSGLKLGVALHRKAGKFQAAITTHGRVKYLGLFETEDAAHAAYIAAKRQLHEGNML